MNVWQDRAIVIGLLCDFVRRAGFNTGISESQFLSTFVYNDHCCCHPELFSLLSIFVWIYIGIPFLVPDIQSYSSEQTINSLLRIITHTSTSFSAYFGELVGLLTAGLLTTYFIMYNRVLILLTRAVIFGNSHFSVSLHHIVCKHYFVSPMSTN